MSFISKLAQATKVGSHGKASSLTRNPRNPQSNLVGAATGPVRAKPQDQSFIVKTDFEELRGMKKVSASDAELEQLRDQIQVLNENLRVNKEMLASFMQGGSENKVQQQLHRENGQLLERLQEQSAKNEKLLHKIAQLESYQSGDQSSFKQAQEHHQRIKKLEQQITHYKQIIVQRDQVAQGKELAYDKLHALATKMSRGNAHFAQKLQELSGSEGPSSAADSALGNQNLAAENQKLQKELELAQVEIGRMREKFFSDVQALGSLNTVAAMETNMGPETIATEAAESPEGHKLFQEQESRNGSQFQGAAFRTADSRSRSVPKLDFNKLKKVRDYKDWYAYSQKLEDNIRFLRDKVRRMEEEYLELVAKQKREAKQVEHFLQLNGKLSRALKAANVKITEVKMKYKQRAAAKCEYCANEVDLSALSCSVHKSVEDDFERKPRGSQLGESGSVDNKSQQITPESSDRKFQIEGLYGSKQQDQLVLGQAQIVLKQDQVRRTCQQPRHVKNARSMKEPPADLRSKMMDQ